MACVLTVVVVDETAPPSAMSATRACTSFGTSASTRSRAITRRSASAKIPASSPSSRRCTIRGATRCIATSDRSRTNPTIRTSSTSYEIAFEPDAALLLCSDGLTDLVHSSSLRDIVKRRAGRPDQVVKELIDAANAAGGKDNISVVYVEGERFASAGDWKRMRSRDHAARRDPSGCRKPPAGKTPGGGHARLARGLARGDGVGGRGDFGGGRWSVAARPRSSPAVGAAAAGCSRDHRCGSDGVDRGGVAARGSGFGRDRRAGRVPRDAEAEGRRTDRQPCPAGSDDSAVRDRVGRRRRRRRRWRGRRGTCRFPDHR